MTAVSEALQNIFGPVIPEGPADVLIYSAAPNERLHYTCRFIFNQVLGLRFRIISDEAGFKSAQGLKINYSDRDINAVFRILPSFFLSERGVSDLKPEPFYVHDRIFFFKAEAGCDMGYDVFSAVFYFISRMEEWQPYTPDRHGRFEAGQSLLFHREFYLKPVVDQWVVDLGMALRKYRPDLRLPEKKLKLISTIDVDNLYAYRNKGFLRSAGATIKDLLKGDLKTPLERLKVLARKKPDPFDRYDEIAGLCEQNNIPLFLFFLFRSSGAYDRTIDPAGGAFKPVLRSLRAKNAFIGIHPSYFSSVTKGMIGEEVQQLADQNAGPVIFSRQHYLRFNIRTTPLELMRSGIVADFTMGYAASAGFRAGTSHPFYYYDFHNEKEESLLFVPFCAMDGAYSVYGKNDPEEAFNQLMNLAAEVKRCGGFFVTVFHERSFSDHLYPGFGTLYKKLHLRIKEELIK